MFHRVLPHHHAAPGGGLARLGAARPIRIRVDVDAVNRLLLERVHEAGCSDEVPADPFQGFPGVDRRPGHPAADLLARELDVKAVGGEVVSSRSSSTEGCSEVARELGAVFLELLEGGLDAGGGNGLGTFQATLSDETLHLPRVAFVLDAVVQPSNNPVQYPALLGVVRSRTHAWGYGQLIVLGDRCLEPVERVRRST